MMVTEERQRLARELHDSVTQSLYGVTMYAEAAARLLDRGVTDEAGRILRELRDTSISALREMRLMIFELRPPSLAEDGLVTAIESRLGAVEARAGLRTEFEYDEIGHLPTAVEEALFGIAREALNNVLKHAGADGVVVRLRLTDAALRLEVVDDGVGFEVGDGRARGGLGLAGMEERSGMTGLKLDVASRPGAGTSVSVEVPRPWPDEN
jgi:signal transduction histidine kinase